MPLPAFAASNVTLTWDPSTDASIAGYRINYGVASGGYTNAVSVGKVTSATISNLVAGTTYFFAAKAFNSSSVESDFSNEVSHSVPAIANQPPTLGTIGNLTVNEDVGLQTVNLSGIGSGAANESQTLAVTATSSNPSLVPNPTVNYTSPNATGNLTFTPVANANGTATITVTINDGQAQNNTVTRAFTVTVSAVNDVPTLNALNTVTLNEDAGVQTVNLSGVGSGAANESQTLAVTATSSNPSLVPNPTVNYTSPNATGALTFTPVANASGSATITVTLNDGQVQNNTITRTFTVTANAVNDGPTLDPVGNLTINENAVSQTVNLAGINAGAANESQTLTVAVVSSNPGLIPNPTVTYTSPNPTGKLAFKPVAYGFGSATIIVSVSDGGASNNIVTRTFTVSVNPANQAPTAGTINNLTINEDAGLQTINLTGIGSGMTNENDTLTVSAVASNPALVPNLTVNYTSPNPTGTLTFTPVTNSYGIATVTVTVNDGQAQSNTVTRTFNVTVRSVNDVPTLDPVGTVALSKGPSQTITLTGIGSGAPNENQTLTVTASSGNPGLIPHPAVSYTSPSSTGSLIFTPTTDAPGSAAIIVTVNDGAPSNNIVTRTFIATVNAVNQPPTLDPLDNFVLDENAGLQTVNLSGIGSGASYESQTLTVTAVSSDTNLIPHPAITYTSPNSTGILNFTPATDAFGGALITVTVNDGQATDHTNSRIFWVSVEPTVAQLSVGSAVLQPGQTRSVAVNCTSSEGVTDMTFLLEVPSGHLTNLTLQALAPEIDPGSSTLVPQAGTTSLLHLATRPGQMILGGKQVAQLTFTAISNQQSAFVPLHVRSFTAIKGNGSLLNNRPAQSGRVVVVGQEALLEATLSSNGTRGLILYGKPSSTFAIEYTTSLTSPRTWTRLTPGISLTTLATPVPVLNSVPSQILYRAAQLSAP